VPDHGATFAPSGCCKRPWEGAVKVVKVVGLGVYPPTKNARELAQVCPQKEAVPLTSGCRPAAEKVASKSARAPTKKRGNSKNSHFGLGARGQVQLRVRHGPARRSNVALPGRLSRPRATCRVKKGPGAALGSKKRPKKSPSKGSANYARRKENVLVRRALNKAPNDPHAGGLGEPRESLQRPRTREQRQKA